MKEFVGSLFVPKSNGNYITFTPKENGIVEKYDSETKETTLVDPSKKDFVGSAYMPKNDGYYMTFTPKENGIVEKYDSETGEITLIDTKKLKYTE